MRYFFSFLLCALLGVVSVASAQSDEFLIRAIVGDDTTPPTDPSIVSVTPLTATQIDVLWSTSTDNWIFGGYVLLRDGSPIATTTQTSYSDIGLTPETEYSYSVYAFDAAGNLSSTSPAVATTTPAIPVAPTSTPPTGDIGDTTSTQTIVLRNFSIEPQKTSALIMWSTNVPTRFTFRWGRTDAYTGGYVTNEVYARTQQTEIRDLEPGTVYRYELVGLSPAGIAVVLQTGQFTTATEAVDRVMPNVERLSATVEGTDVVLSYDLPATERGARVRIVRSHLGFPIDLYDGAVVYEGSASSWRDVGALAVFGTEYYTVFAIGADGTVSSGAVVMARYLTGVSAERPHPGGGMAPSTSTPPGDFTEPTIPLALLSEQAIVIRQETDLFTFLSEGIELSPREPFTISIGTEALPRHLKSIIVTLLDPTDQRRSYSFLLRINKAGTAYEATVAPVVVFGASRLQVEVYDYEAAVVGRYRVPVQFVPSRAVAPVVFPDAFVAPLMMLWPVLLGLVVVIMLVWLFFVWRRRRAEDKT